MSSRPDAQSHTPGPWFVDPGLGRGKVPEFDSVKSKRRQSLPADWLPELWVQSEYGDRAKWPANARLIAAAPELLKVADDLLWWVAFVKSTPELEAVKSAAKAAIAKATTPPMTAENPADRELEAVALGFDSAQDRADYERKMLGDRHCDLVERLRAHQYRGFDETNANLNEAAHVIAELLDTIWLHRRQLARVRAIAKDHCNGSTLDRLRSGLLDILDSTRP